MSKPIKVVELVSTEPFSPTELKALKVVLDAGDAGGNVTLPNTSENFVLVKAALEEFDVRVRDEDGRIVVFGPTLASHLARRAQAQLDANDPTESAISEIVTLVNEGFSSNAGNIEAHAKIEGKYEEVVVEAAFQRLTNQRARSSWKVSYVRSGDKWVFSLINWG